MNYTDLYYSDLTAVQKCIPNLLELKNSKIFITGATGLIGSCIVDFLLNLNDTTDAKNVIYIGSLSTDDAEGRFGKVLEREDIKYIEYNALKEITFDIAFDYIIHAASLASPELYVTKPVETMLCNLMGLQKLLEYCCKKGVKRILYISSSEVYGKKENNEPYKIDEYGYLDILGNRASYPSAKRASETLCASYASEYGIDVMIVRPGHIYGPTATPGDKRASSQFFRDVIGGSDIIMKSAGSQLRSYCYVVDCASAILTVMLNGKVCFPYNIANTDSNITIRELAETISRCSGKKVVFENPSDSEKKAFNMMDNSCLDSTELYNLGWKGEFDSESGISHTYQIMNCI
ncbi:MAG: NAD-dependent epimerase/dehydratase family protein [Ruminococcus sp.]|nr:NAD-dependent epimerase/dehydratase family protein [Ruminococcus sp.]